MRSLLLSITLSSGLLIAGCSGFFTPTESQVPYTRTETDCTSSVGQETSGQTSDGSKSGEGSGSASSGCKTVSVTSPKPDAKDKGDK